MGDDAVPGEDLNTPRRPRRARPDCRLVTTRLSSALVALLALAVAGCAGSGGEVSEAEAREVLQTAVDATFASDEEALCALYSDAATCERQLREAGGFPSAPSAAPELVDSYPFQRPGDAESAGWVLVLQGVNGAGEPYRNQFLVFDGGSHGLVARHPVWWTDLGVGFSPSTG